MYAFPPRRLLSLVAALAIALVVAPASQASADVGTFHFEDVVTDPTSLPECMPPALADIVGAQTATETFDGRFTATASGFHVEGTGNLVYRVDFPDGRYVLGEDPSRFTFDTSVSGQTVNNDVIREPRTIYDADGDVIGHVQIHALAHSTFGDANGNGQPDPGEISVTFERFFFTCR